MLVLTNFNTISAIILERMRYEKDKNTLYFIESPIQGLYGRKANETINALNEILGIIFSYSKKSDYTVLCRAAGEIAVPCTCNPLQQG